MDLNWKYFLIIILYFNRVIQSARMKLLSTEALLKKI